jgi:tetratricopeptide (TPR) repeat protein
MTGGLASARDRAVLRSFARRIDASDAGAHNNLGVLYYNKGLYEESVEAFTRALELDPKMQVARRNLEVAYFNTGFYDQRVTALRERLRVNAEDRDARWELGRAYALLGQTADAVAEFTALLRYFPDDLPALIQLGLAEKAQGDLTSARHWFDRALAVDPDHALVHYYVGEVLYNQGMTEDAREALSRSIALNADNPDAHFLLAFVLGDLGRHDEAQVASKRAIQLNPALSRAQANLSLDQYNPQKYEELLPGRRERQSAQMQAAADEGGLAHYTLGTAFRQKGYYAEALREYRIGLDKGEDRDLVLQAMAEVHLLKKDPTAAIELYDRLLLSQPHSPKLWNERGVALHQSGRIDEAQASYRRALAADMIYALAHNNSGVVLAQQGDHEGAIDAFRAALDAQAGFEKARLNLALLLCRAKRIQLGLEAYRQVLRTSPEHPVAWNGIGVVLADLKKYADARNAYARAIQARPDYAEAHYNMSFTLSNLGDFDGALRETKRALELEPYYVPQKFELAIDLEFEDGDMAVLPDLGANQRESGEVQEFSFDPKLLDDIFVTIAPAPVVAPTPAEEASPYALATDYLTSGLLDRAAAEARRVLQRGVATAAGHTILGDVHARQGAHGEALEQYRSALLLDAGHRPALRGEVQAFVALHRPHEARPSAERLLAMASVDPDTLLLVAAVRFEDGDPAGALAALETARTEAPARADVHRRFGDIARAMGDSEQALIAYRHALALDSDFAAVRFAVAQLLIERSDASGAEDELVAALDAVPTYTEAALSLARLRRDTGRAVEAIPLLVDLLQRDLTNLDALYALAETLWVLGRTDDAAYAVERILRFEPAHVGAWYLTGAMAAAQQRFRTAIGAWQRVIELEPAGELARQARREMRTAQDLQHIMGARSAQEG